MTSSKKLIVLIIDDDEDDRFFMEQVFKTDSPYTYVYTVEGGQQALDWLSAAQSLPNVILLDLNMPLMHGFEVLQILKQSALYHLIPIMILTTSSAATDQEKARQLGVTEFITKPIVYGDLSGIAEQIRLRTRLIQ